MDDNSFRDLVVAEQARLLSTAWVLTTNADEAQDLVQDTLVRGYVKRRLLARADSPSAYLRTIMVNLWRGRKHRREHPAAVEADRPVQDTYRLERQALVAALHRLSPQQRAIVALRYVDDLSIRDTARALGCSNQTVTTQAARALNHLRTNPTVRELLEES